MIEQLNASITSGKSQIASNITRQAHQLTENQLTENQLTENRTVSSQHTTRITMTNQSTKLLKQAQRHSRSLNPNRAQA
jgi:hypothetical protein